MLRLHLFLIMLGPYWSKCDINYYILGTLDNTPFCKKHLENYGLIDYLCSNLWIAPMDFDIDLERTFQE